MLNKNDIENVIREPLKENIYQFIQQAQKEGSLIRLKLLSLKDKYLDVQTVGNYHDIGLKGIGGRFSGINGPYYRLAFMHQLISDKRKIGLLYQLYHEIQEIIYSNIINTEAEFNYSFYYNDPKTGQVLRISTNRLRGLELSFDKKTLIMTKSAFEKAYRSEIEEARRNSAQAAQITNHFEALKNTYGRKKVRQAYVAEAFERDLKRRHGNYDNLLQHEWTEKEAWELYAESKGNDPWYTGGDILSQLYNIQVKSFLGKRQTKFSGFVSITKANTIEDILNYLISFTDQNIDINRKVEEAYQVFSQAESSSFDTISRLVNETANSLVESIKIK